MPDEQHYEVARELLEAGIHTLLVKPFVTSTDHARELIRLVDQRAVGRDGRIPQAMGPIQSRSA